MKKPKQPEHSLFAFSAGPRWISCPGSMAYPENTDQGDADGGIYANEGTMMHLVASYCLKQKEAAEDYLGMTFTVGKDTFEFNDEHAEVVQTYVDDVLRRSLGGYLMIEQRLTLDGVDGFDASNYGTGDAVIGMPARRLAEGSMPAYGVIEDLKGGAGEKVYCWEYAKKGAPFTMTTYVDDEAVEAVPNYQLMMYALAARKDLELFIDDLAFIRIVICQPRLNSLQELDVPVAVLDRFALFAAEALKRSTYAMGLGVKAVESVDNLLVPGDKQCRWCKALAICPAAAKRVVKEVGAEFDVIPHAPPIVSAHTVQVAKAVLAIPYIRDWCNAVQAKVHELVAAGEAVMGPDGKPYKFVEGDLGDRKWADPVAAEAALVETLGVEKAYAPRKILTAPAASKILDKKKTKELWKDKFEPMIKRAPGKPVLAIGSDSRPAYSPASDADEFETLGGAE